MASPPRILTAEEFKLRLQIETTLLVWVRTSLSLMGFGFVIARFGLFLRELAGIASEKLTAHPSLAVANNLTGTLMIVAGVVVMLISLYNHHRMILRLERGDLSFPTRWSLGTVVGFFVAALGIGLASYLLMIL